MAAATALGQKFDPFLIIECHHQSPAILTSNTNHITRTAQILEVSLMVHLRLPRLWLLLMLLLPLSVPMNAQLLEDRSECANGRMSHPP
jgi:hypothetical protein